MEAMNSMNSETSKEVAAICDRHPLSATNTEWYLRFQELAEFASRLEAEAKQWEQSSADSVHKLAKAQAEVAELKGEHERMENSLIDILVKGTTEKQFLSVPEMQAAFVKDQLTQLQQDVRPLLEWCKDAADDTDGSAPHGLVKALETFLAKHPELK